MNATPAESTRKQPILAKAKKKRATPVRAKKKQAIPAKATKRRVTLTLDPGVHQEAVRIAKARGMSFSGLVQSVLSQQHERTTEEWMASLRSHAAGVEVPPRGEDPLFDSIWEKHVHGTPREREPASSEEAA